MKPAMLCAGCDRPILDRFLLNVLDRAWHAKCVVCYDCTCALTEKCYAREDKLYCRDDFFRFDCMFYCFIMCKIKQFLGFISPIISRYYSSLCLKIPETDSPCIHKRSLAPACARSLKHMYMYVSKCVCTCLSQVCVQN